MSKRDPFLTDLEAEEARIRKQIDNLKAELRSVERMIFRRKTSVYGDAVGEKVNNRNIDKLFFESIILDILVNKPSGLRTGELFKAVLSRGHMVNHNTFRSYVVDMQKTGKIAKKDRGYNWVNTKSIFS